MFGWTPRDLRTVPDVDPSPLTYRAEIRSRDGVQNGDLHLYDGGEFTPYCIESLLDLLRSEARTARRELEMTFDLLGSCSIVRLQEIATRFASASIAGLNVTVRASGHAPLRVGESASAATGATPTTPVPPNPSTSSARSS